LDTCCSTPIDDYFVATQKTVCNGGKTDAVLFKNTKEYMLNKHQNILNKLDLVVNGKILNVLLICCASCVVLLVAKLGKPAVNRNGFIYLISQLILY
jgi:hypothetical protein